jgi:hypothetical protein
MSKHTPGPWRYQGETTRRLNQPDSAVFEVYTATGEYGHPATCGKEEDACLIAAAPELLAALKETVSHLMEDDKLFPALHPVGKCPVLINARAAIAKAEGRT